VLTGYAAVFNRSSVDLGGFTEEIDSSAFANVLGDDVRGVVDHDSARILGRTTAKTMQVGTDERGLWYAIAVPDTAVGRDILTSVRRGDITGSSFKFWTEDDTWAMRNGIAHRTILRVKRLLDVGPVTFPAYPDSTAEAQRSLASWKESAASSSGAEVGYDERRMKQREAQTRG
jgi:HK97 family phage prohead protease